MIRLFDILISMIGLMLLFPVLIIIFIIGIYDTGSPIFRQKRVGKNQKTFTLVKFRTMRIDTSSLPSHLIDASVITPFGVFLRRSKIDELPQLWNVLAGEMSLVGPRPCLLSQSELIEEREFRGVFGARPGITGLAQINRIDMSTPKLLAETDANMIRTMTPFTYFSYIFMTLIGKGSGDVVK